MTTIELVVVLVVTAVLAAMAVPRFTSADTTLMAQAHRLARDLRHVQVMAMNQGRTLIFNVQSVSSYAVTSGGSVVIDPATSQPYTVKMNNNVTLNGIDTEIDSMGRPKAAGTLLAAERVFTLEGNSRSVAIVLSPVTGFVSVLP